MSEDSVAQNRGMAYLYNAEEAGRLRRMLMTIWGCYPTGDTVGDTGWDYYENNIRTNLLPAVVASLDRNDLIAIMRIAEVLAGHPRGADFPWCDDGPKNENHHPA